MDISKFSKGQNTFKVGDYNLVPHYNAKGTLIFYAAGRNQGLGIEYIIRADALQTFKDKVGFYTSSANVFYLNNGVPDKNTVLLAAGKTFEQRWEGLKNMWSNAVNSAEWWAFNIAVLGVHVSCFQTTASRVITYRNVTSSGANYVNFEITSHSFSEFKNIISSRTGLNWSLQTNTISGDVFVIQNGGVKYIARDFASNGNYSFTIEYYRNTSQPIGVYRFTK